MPKSREKRWNYANFGSRRKVVGRHLNNTQIFGTRLIAFVCLSVPVKQDWQIPESSRVILQPIGGLNGPVNMQMKLIRSMAITCRTRFSRFLRTPLESFQLQ